MMPALLLLPAAHSQPLHWRLPDASAHSGIGNWTDAAHALAGLPVLAVAPGETVTLLSARLPDVSAARLAQMLPFALEDWLVDDADQYHFATLRQGAPGESRPVAAVRRSLMQAWHAHLSTAGLDIRALIPEPLLLPWESGAWHARYTQGRCCIRTGPWQGFSAAGDAAVALLRHALLGAGADAPRHIRVQGDAQSLAQLPPLAIPQAEWQQLADGNPAHLPDTCGSLDLLQGAFTLRRPRRWERRAWQAAAMSFAAALLLHFAGSLYHHWRLQQEKTALWAEMKGLYLKAQPDAKQIINPRHQLQTLLTTRGADPAGQPGLLHALAVAGPVLAREPRPVLKRLEYQQGQLELDLELPGLAQADSLRASMTQPGWRAEVLHASKEAGKVNARLRLSRSPAT